MHVEEVFSSAGTLIFLKLMIIYVTIFRIPLKLSVTLLISTNQQIFKT